ncbi:MAG: tyrosine-type recombinase/integrase [Actinomycetota bacterium]
MGEKASPHGAARLSLVDGATLLHPEESVFAGMLDGWERQQRSRLLRASTIRNRAGTVRSFASFTNDYPWNWSPSDVEEWSTHLLGNGCARSTLRNYHQLLALFMSYLIDARYGWVTECEERFGTHPVQICHEWNTAVHTSEFEGRPETRPFTRDELQGFFDHADERVATARSRGRKGWLSAFRDATLFKAMYAWGLRRTEAAKLDVIDFLPNPSAPIFGDYGKLSVRFGKATRGGAPRRRTVLTVMDWSSDVLAEYVDEIRPLYDHHDSALWPTERRQRLSPAYINARFAEYRAEMGLAEELHPHCLRHAYVTHLVEDGFDSLFVQQQVGHEWASTTAIYTGVTSDYKNQILKRALSRAFGETKEIR